MNLLRTVEPAELPVTLAEARAQLREPPTAENGLISALIQTATAMLESRDGFLGRALVSQSWTLKIHQFPGVSGRIELPFPPLISVDAITYINEAGDEITVPSTEYVVDTGTFRGRIRPGYLKTWPQARLDDYAVSIEFTCGYGAAAAVPAPLKQAILLLVGHWFRHREAIGAIPGGMQFSVEALCSTYRVGDQ